MLSSKVEFAKVGDLIRSLDFAGIDDHYMIGIVVEVEGDFIKCQATSRVWSGIAQAPEDKFFTTVQNGCHFMDNRYPGRITIL